MAWNKKFTGLSDEQISVIFENSFGLKKVNFEPAFFSKEAETLVFEPGLFVISTSLKGRGVKCTHAKNFSDKLKSLVSKAKNIVVPLSFEFHDFSRGIGSLPNISSHFAILYVKNGIATFIDAIVKDKTNINHYKRWKNVKSKVVPALKKELNVSIRDFFFHRFKQSN